MKRDRDRREEVVGEEESCGMLVRGPGLVMGSGVAGGASPPPPPATVGGQGGSSGVGVQAGVVVGGAEGLKTSCVRAEKGGDAEKMSGWRVVLARGGGGMEARGGGEMEARGGGDGMTVLNGMVLRERGVGVTEVGVGGEAEWKLLGGRMRDTTKKEEAVVVLEQGDRGEIGIEWKCAC